MARFGEAAQRAAFMNAMADVAPAPAAAEALAQLQQEIEDVEKDIAANERWEGGRPCGAEAQRARLASLSECLAALTGAGGGVGGSRGSAQQSGHAAAAFIAAAAGGKFQGGSMVRDVAADGVENAQPSDV
jgi:hypothetical protein